MFERPQIEAPVDTLARGVKNYANELSHAGLARKRAAADPEGVAHSAAAGGKSIAQVQNQVGRTGMQAGMQQPGMTQIPSMPMAPLWSASIWLNIFLTSFFDSDFLRCVRFFFFCCVGRGKKARWTIPAWRPAWRRPSGTRG